MLSGFFVEFSNCKFVIYLFYSFTFAYLHYKFVKQIFHTDFNIFNIRSACWIDCGSTLLGE